MGLPRGAAPGWTPSTAHLLPLLDGYGPPGSEPGVLPPFESQCDAFCQSNADTGILPGVRQTVPNPLIPSGFLVLFLTLKKWNEKYWISTPGWLPFHPREHPR